MKTLWRALATFTGSALLAGSCSAEDQAASAASRFAPAVERLADALERKYVYPDVGAQYAIALRTALADGVYDGYADETALADRLTADLTEVSRDGHLSVFPSEPEPVRTPPRRRAGFAPVCADREPGAARSGERPPAIVEACWIADAVAYIRFDGFPSTPETAAAADRFMQEHADARALVIDARDNGGGGQAEMDAMLPYLFAEETTLVAMEVAESVAAELEAPDETPTLRPAASPPGLIRREHFVRPHPTERRLFDAEVFYLVSGRTASAAEHLALIFKRTGRATLVGETTAGANHFGEIEELGEGLAAFVPIGRTLDPDTGADWEGVGVAPDIPAPPQDALAEALRLSTAE